MQLRDWPLRKRLLFSNFIMIYIPVLFTVVVSIAIFLALQFGNINRANPLSGRRAGRICPSSSN